MNHDQILQTISKNNTDFPIIESTTLAEIAADLDTNANEAIDGSHSVTKSHDNEILVKNHLNSSVIHRIKINSLKSINGSKLYGNNKNINNSATNIAPESFMLINILYPISTMSILALISNSNDSSNLDCFQNINYFCNETINLRQCHLIELECELQAKGTSADEIPERTNENIPSSDSQKHFGVIFPLPNHIYGFFKLENVEITSIQVLLGNENIRHDIENNWLDIMSSNDLISRCENLHLDSENINTGKRKESLSSDIEFSMKPPAQIPRLSSFMSSSSLSSSLTIKDDESKNTTLSNDYQMEKKIPSEEEEGKDQVLPQVIIENPIDFLTTRYYSTLYSLNNPLSYFPKTALPRFKNLISTFKSNLDIEENSKYNDEHTNSSSSNIIEGLREFWLNVDAFDRRHNQRYGVFGDVNDGSDTDMNNQVNDELSNIELIEQQKFKSNHGFDLNQPTTLSEHQENSETMDIDNKGNENGNQIHGITMEKLSQLILDLKIREAQLQILIIFELLNLMHVEEQEFLTKNKNIQLDKEAQKSKNQSLVRRKRRKNKKKQPNSEKDILSPAIIQSVETEKQFQLFMSLTTYIDRLSLWDTLSVKSGGAGMYGFIGYVLVPYFHKKLPKLVEFVVESMKSLNMKLVSLKRKKSDQVDTEEHEQVDTEIEHGTTPQESDTPKHQDETLKMKPRSKYRKVLLDKNPPKLSKSTSIVDSDDFKPLISLKKSKSNLSAKHLSKREVDLNLKQSSKADFSSISTASLSFIFGTRAKKSLSASTVTTSRPTRTKSEKIATTPVKPKLKHSVSQIEATPAKARKVYMQPQVQATPVAPQQQPLLLLLQQQQQQRHSISISPSHKENNASTLSESAYLLEVEATPLKSNSLVITTPTDQFIKPDNKHRQSINEKLSSLSKYLTVEMTPKQNNLIFSTPRNIRITTDPGMVSNSDNKGTGNETNIVFNTPLHHQQLIGSSPLKSRRESVSSVTSIISNTNNNHNHFENSYGKSGPKPSDPVALESSPFISILSDSENLMGLRPKKLFDSITTSPQDKNYDDEKVVKNSHNNNEYDSEYDSDELLNPSSKQTVRSTYSKRRK